jgi:nitroimidazol reductase NimA-like FMN-containing flavoprotein (pyridoxamine 5'-phosphate oxidase superfamily)
LVFGGGVCVVAVAGRIYFHGLFIGRQASAVQERATAADARGAMLRLTSPRLYNRRAAVAPEAAPTETAMPRPDIRLTPDEQEGFLRSQRKCALATLDKAGFPHLVAMNYAYRDGTFYMTSYGKAQKVLNARRDAKAAVMIETGAAYSELKGVMARGTCEIIDDPERVSEVFGWLGGGGRATARPSGSTQSAPKRVVMQIKPQRIVSWDHAKLGGRY